MPEIDKWTTYATRTIWKKIDIDAKKIKAAIGYRSVHAQFGNILGWLRDLGELDLYREVEQAIDNYNAETRWLSDIDDNTFNPR